jgi:hypothetical protein
MSWDEFFTEAMKLPGWDWAMKTLRPATLDVVFGMGEPGPGLR